MLTWVRSHLSRSIKIWRLGMVRAERAMLPAALNADGEAGAAALCRRRPESVVRARNRTWLGLGARGCCGEPEYGVRAGHRRPQRARDGKLRRADSGEATRTREKDREKGWVSERPLYLTELLGIELIVEERRNDDVA
jgi:hypothetical protein